jgi:hypothetical protein
MTALTATRGADIGAIARAFAPGTFHFDPLGIVSGFKAYLIYSGLSAKSDAELAELGLTRAEIGRASMDAARMLRAA